MNWSGRSNKRVFEETGEKESERMQGRGFSLMITACFNLHIKRVRVKVGRTASLRGGVSRF